MSYSSENGYIPLSIDEMMEVIRVNVNAQFNTTYTQETFLGTNYYKYFYAMIQRAQQNEVKTAEIFQKIQNYFGITNEKLQRPNTTPPGLIDYFGDRSYLVSVKKPIDEDAGKLSICVDVDDGDEDYEETKLEICNLVNDCCVGGVVSQGTEVESITLSNGQAFDFKFNLPDRIPVALRLTLVTSDNNEYTIASPVVTKQKLFDNIKARYKLGKNFEPQRYFSVSDAPWAATILLEWTDDVTDGEPDEMAVWSDDVFEAEYDELFDYSLNSIEIVES